MAQTSFRGPTCQPTKLKKLKDFFDFLGCNLLPEPAFKRTLPVPVRPIQNITAINIS